MATAPSPLAVAMGSAPVLPAVTIARASAIHGSGRQPTATRVAGQPPGIRDTGIHGSNGRTVNVNVDKRNAPVPSGVSV